MLLTTGSQGTSIETQVAHVGQQKSSPISCSIIHTTECFCFPLRQPPLSLSTSTIHHPFNRAIRAAPSNINPSHHSPPCRNNKGERQRRLRGERAARMRSWGPTLQWGVKSTSHSSTCVNLGEGENDKLDWLAIMLWTRLVLSNACKQWCGLERHKVNGRGKAEGVLWMTASTRSFFFQDHIRLE